jgi:small subunit ribosomal protein S17
MAHDENGRCKTGDTVEIVQSRPLSARKRWRVSRIVKSVASSAATEAAATE